MNTHNFPLRLCFLFLILGLLTAGCENTAPSSSAERSSTTRGAADPPEKTKPAGEKAVAAEPKGEEFPAPAKSLAQKKNVETQEPAAAPPAVRTEEEEKEVPPEKAPPIPDSYKPLNKDKNLFFEKTAEGKRRVHILAEVCLRDGGQGPGGAALEVLLCKTNSKEHEAILSADVDAREIHAALIIAGAKPGSTVKFQPVYKSATGDTIKVSVTYHLKGKINTKPAQFWIRDARTKKEMAHDWVFAGSRLFQDPDDPDKPPFYCANNGEVIAVANFPDSMLDLPVESPRDWSNLSFTAFTDRIPPLKTKVIVTLEPVAAAEKK